MKTILIIAIVGVIIIVIIVFLIKKTKWYQTTIPPSKRYKHYSKSNQYGQWLKDDKKGWEFWSNELLDGYGEWIEDDLNMKKGVGLKK